MSFLKKENILLYLLLFINFYSINSMEINDDNLDRNQSYNSLTTIPTINFLRITHFPINTYSPTIKKNIHTHVHTHNNQTHTHTHDHTYTPEGKLVRSHPHLHKGYFTKVPYHSKSTNFTKIPYNSISINSTKIPYYSTLINFTKISYNSTLINFTKIPLYYRGFITNSPNKQIADQSNSVNDRLKISLLSLFSPIISLYVFNTNNYIF